MSEMPEKIWARENLEYEYSGTWTASRSAAGSYIPYIRTDIIPNKAEIANEFCLAVIERTNKIIKSGEIDSMADDIYGIAHTRATREILQEWRQSEL